MQVIGLSFERKCPKSETFIIK